MKEEKSEFDDWAVIVAFPLGMAVVLAFVVWRAYVLSLLWDWFIVPAFGAPAMTMATGVGVLLIAAMFTPKSARKHTTPEVFAHGLIGPAMFLLLGWMTQSWWL